jgi:arylsulfatase A-like enzyme
MNLTLCPIPALLLFSGVLFFSGALRISQVEAAKPNILFLFSDDHSPQAISAYGSKINVTPNMDRLANEGMLFKRCYVTNSLCGPVRAVIQTGKYSHINGFLDNNSVFNGSQPTFPKLLQKAGYQTAVIGKWHLVSDPQGFDYWDVLPGQGVYYNPPTNRNGVTVNNAGYNTEITTNLGLNWLRTQRDKNKPFMLMLQYKAPHRNWDPGPNELGLYRSGSIPEPTNLFDDYATRGSAAHLQTMNISAQLNDKDLKLAPPTGLTPTQMATWNAAYASENQAFTSANLQGDALTKWKYQRYIADYLRCVAGVDKGIGHVLDYLDSAGLKENTIVIYSSDQGFYLGEHGWFDKRFMYEESLHTPLLVRWPGSVKPKSIDTNIVSDLDFAETFLDAAGIAVPADMQGSSLVPILKGSTPSDWRKSFYYQYFEFPSEHNVYRHYGVTTGRFKLIYFQDVQEWEFYDLKYDPAEMHNQYYVPANQVQIAALKKELERLRLQYQVPADIAWPTPVKTITFDKITVAIPKPGCMDAAYKEFDPEADTPLASACKITVSNSKLEKGIQRRPSIRVFDDRVEFILPHELHSHFLVLRSISGKIVDRFPTKEQTVRIWKRPASARGVYILANNYGETWKFTL